MRGRIGEVDEALPVIPPTTKKKKKKKLEGRPNKEGRSPF